eukprot:TRINITY_DN25874_c0_g1_i1.p1 TRINITY_DN25874_c0_g1~~TRINITY_DN25874_c0_g1_i1.p1  ORF type:complete len:1179 (-),score=192.41 TRINITY_DN25874_c0_g1_i1:24-3560(-)
MPDVLPEGSAVAPAVASTDGTASGVRAPSQGAPAVAIATVAAPAPQVTVAAPAPTGAAMARASSRGAVRIGGSATMPVAPSVSRESSAAGVPSLAPQQYAWRGSGGSLPCAQAGRPIQRLASGSMPVLRASSVGAVVRQVTPATMVAAPPAYPAHGMPFAHLTQAVAVPLAPAVCPNCGNTYAPDALFCRRCGMQRRQPQGTEVRELSPGRPAVKVSVYAEPWATALRSLSPGRPVVSALPPAAVVQMSPRMVIQQRSLSPTPGLRPSAAASAGPAVAMPQSPQQSPSRASHRIASPQRQSSNPTDSAAVLTASPPRPRSMSPPGLPSAPLFPSAAVPAIPGSPVAEGTQSTPTRAVIRQTTPRGVPAMSRIAVQRGGPMLITPRGVAMPANRTGTMTPGAVLQGLRTACAPGRQPSQPSRPSGDPALGRGNSCSTVKRATSTGAVVSGPRSSASASQIRRKGSVAHERRSPNVTVTPSSGAGHLPPRRQNIGNLSSPQEAAEEAANAEATAEDEAARQADQLGSASCKGGQMTQDPRFEPLKNSLDEPGAAEAACQQLLAKLQAGSSVRWEELVNLDPVPILSEVAAGSLASPSSSLKVVRSAQDTDQDLASCQGWWRALLARHGLYGPGNVMGAAELSELVVAALRFLRDRYAPEDYLRNLRTVHSGSKRVKDRYGSFRFEAHGMLGKSYRCRSRLTREEHICRQVRKDKLQAPSDLVRAEVEVLRSLEHPNVPQVIASFEDFGNIYVVLEPVEAVEMLQILQHWHKAGQGLRVSWLAEVMRQLLEVLKHCHELRPHSLVHGDLRLTSLLLAADRDAETAPSLVLADVGLAGLPPPPPPCSWRGKGQVHPVDALPVHGGAPTSDEEWLQCASPKLDVWSCGCLLFLLLSGQHPFGGDPGGRLVPSVVAGRNGAAPPEPDWRLLPSAAAASLCAQMLTWDAKARLGTAECLRHSWLSVSTSAASTQEDFVPVKALGNLLAIYEKSRLQQVFAGIAISELIQSPLTSVGAALAVQSAFDKGVSTPGTQQEHVTSSVVSVEDATSALDSLGVSANTIRDIVSAFTIDGKGSTVDYGLLASSCNKLAEDLLDHALWRIFIQAGEDHRGMLGTGELEKELSANAAGGADRAGGGEQGARGLLDSHIKEIIRQVVLPSQEIAFEDLKAAVISQQVHSSPPET